MASIIESLYITLGLDVSDFTKGKEKALDGLKKVDSEQEKLNQKSTKRTKSDDAEKKKAEVEDKKRSESSLKRGKEEQESFSKITESIVKFGAVMATVGMVKEFITSQVQTNAQLGRTSQLLNRSSKELNAWGAAAKTTGGDSAEFIGAIQNMQEGLAKAQVGLGGEEIVKTFSRIGYQAKNGKVDLLELGDALKKVRNAQGELIAKSMAQTLGFDEKGYLLLTKNREELEKLVETMGHFGNQTPEVISSADKITTAWGKMTQALSGQSTKLFDNIAPEIERTIHGATKLIGLLSGDKDLHFRSTKEIWAKMHGENSSSHSNEGTDKKINNGGSDSKSMIDFFKSKGWSENQSKGIVANIIRESSGNPMAEGDPDKNGNNQAYGLGQWHPDRQNNFKSVFGKDIRQSTAQEQMEFYNWELKNTEKAAGDALKQTTGAGESASVVSRMFERPANAYQEANNRANLANNFPMTDNNSQGNQSNGATVETNINTINVVTQAKDAYGMADGMRDALSKNQLVMSGIGGAR